MRGRSISPKCERVGEGPVASIFLSYAREDLACAERLAHVLQQARHEVWWDRRIGTGHEFSAEIETALEKSDLVLVAWSKHAAKSPWVRDEAAVGRDRGRLFPVIIDGCQAPIGFRQFQALDLSGWKGREKDLRTAELIEAVNAQLSGKPAEFRRRARRFGWIRDRAAWTAAVALALSLGVAIALVLNSRDRQGGALSKPTIALLPFTTSSPEPGLRELASQSRDSIAHTFTQSGLPLRLMDSAPQKEGPAVDFFISGDVNKNGDKVITTVRLDEAAHHVTVFSHRFEASREEIRDLPERIGAQMAGNLTWRAPLAMLDRRDPIDPALLAELLQGGDFAGDTSDLQAYQNASRAVAKAPNRPIIQASLAFGTAFALGQLPREERRKAVETALRAAERAIALEPDFGDTYATWCMLHSETRIVECEDRLRSGRRVDPDAPFLNTFLGHLYREVGRFDEAMELARMAHAHDQYVPTKIAWMLRMYEYAGESVEARDLYQQGVKWWPEYQPMFFRNRLWGLLDRGDFEAIGRLEQEMGQKLLPPTYPSIGPLVIALKSKSIGAARRACAVRDHFFVGVRCMLALAILGDHDRAFEIADENYPRRVGRTPAETERIWLDEPEGPPLELITSPAASSLRRDPRFLQLAERVGLLAYWRSGRRPDFCRKRPEPVCKKLMK